jgi:hypothetical protein
MSLKATEKIAKRLLIVSPAACQGRFLLCKPKGSSLEVVNRTEQSSVSCFVDAIELCPKPRTVTPKEL